LVTRELARGKHRVTAVVRSRENCLTECLKEDVVLVDQVEGTVLGMESEGEVEGLVKDCDAVLICLGHTLTMAGVFGAPRRLVRDTVKRVAKALGSSGARGKKKKIILMNSNGVRNKLLVENYPWHERMLLGLLYFALPPHADNVEASEYLTMEVAKEHPEIEWVCVRPGDLLDGEEHSNYGVSPSPAEKHGGPVLGSAKTSRYQVAHFMASLATNDKLWDEWKGKTPAIYNEGEETEG